MLKCPNCGTAFKVDHEICHECQFKPDVINGFTAWAAELAHENTGFNPESFKLLAAMEGKNFWFNARNKLIVWALKKYFPDLKTFLEIGCGTGFVLSGVAKAFPDAELVGSEIFVEGLGFANQRVPNATLLQMDGRAIPFKDHFDVAIAVDVIEHIDEDEAVLSELYEAVKIGGGIIISVPQHKWLWSQADDFACHKRRYQRGEVERKVTAAGFDIVRSTSFVSLLLPAMAVSRRRKQDSKTYNPTDEFNISPTLNSVLEAVLGVERGFISLGGNFPIGGSRFVVARKTK